MSLGDVIPGTGCTPEGQARIAASIGRWREWRNSPDEDTSDLERDLAEQMELDSDE